MGNQASKNSKIQEKEESSVTKETIELVEQESPEKRWRESQKTVEDLQQLMKQCNRWPQIIRSFLQKITDKGQYQLYLRAILQQIIQRSSSQQLEVRGNDKKYAEDSLDDLMQSERGMIQKGQKVVEKQEGLKAQSSISRQQGVELFNFFKRRLQESYFVVNYQKGGVREKIGQTQFEHSLKQLWNIQNSKAQQQLAPQLSHHSHSYSQSRQSFTTLIPTLMVSQLYQFSSLKQNYMDEMFIQLNLKAYDSLQDFARLLIEEFIVVEDEFNLTKFIISREVLLQSLSYLQTCAKILPQSQKLSIFQRIKEITSHPSHHYIQMCHIFLQYKNVHVAQFIIRNLIQKGYHLSQDQMNFYFYIQAYSVFLYSLNFSLTMLNEHPQRRHQTHEKKVESHGSFLSFKDGFERFTIQQILHKFLSFKSYSEIDQIKRCFETAFSIYDPKKGETMFLHSLKSYALSPQSHFIITIQALKSHLTSLEEKKREGLQFLFLQKLSLQSNTDIIDYQRHVVDVIKLYHFSNNVYEFVKRVFKVSSILKKFQISIKISELYQFLFHNKRLNLTKQIKQRVMVSKSHEKSPQELQFLALVIIKKVITKYFILGQSKDQVVFIMEDKFDDECFEYSTKEIESLFILTEYLHKNLFEIFVPLQQLHQLLFQHMLYYSKYDQVEIMLREENLQRYFIQEEVVKMLILENIRETLVKSEKQISSLSQEIKKQIKIVENMFQNKKTSKRNQQENEDESQENLSASQVQELQQMESIRALFKLLVKLDFYSISLNQQQKQNIGINLLYFLIEYHQHQIEVFDYDQLYRLIVLTEGKNQDFMQQTIRGIKADSGKSKENIPVTNQYLKFKIDLAHMSFQKGRVKFGESILKQVIQYEPPWISSEIIKIIQKSPHSTGINQNFMNIAFEYCVKGQDLVYLLKVYKQKISQKQKKSGQKISDLFQSTKKYIVVDDSYIRDENQYRNLIGQMSFNDETLKSQEYDLFFTLLGTEPERAFYQIYAKNLDLVKIEIILKQGMKMGILNISNIIKIFFKLLFFIITQRKDRNIPESNCSSRVSFVKFRNTSIDEVLSQVQSTKLLSSEQAHKALQKEIPFILLKKMYKALRSMLILPGQFIQNYLENPSVMGHEEDHTQLFYMFCFDQNYREKHLIALKDEPMGKSDIKIYKELCHINGLNILDLVIFNLTNQLNAIDIYSSQIVLEEQKMQNVIQKIVTWTQNDLLLVHQVLSKLCTKIFSSQMLYNILETMREKENPLIRQVVSLEHMQIIQSLKQIEVNTQFHGIITDLFFSKPISFNPKHKLSEKHIKILKKELKLTNVFLISKILYFCYGMSNEVEKQVLKMYIKEKQNEQEKQIFEQLRKKLHEAES